MADETHSEPARRHEIKTVFLSYHFEEEKAFVGQVAECIERQGLDIVTGQRLGGYEVNSVVYDRIRTADSLIGLLTRRYKIGDPEMELWDTYPWVRDELTYGYYLGKPAIAVVENGVEVVGAFSNYERLMFHRDQLKATIENLKNTLLLWTGKLGANPIKVRLSPAEAVKELQQNRNLRGRYRWWSPPNNPEDWVSANVNFIAGGAFVWAHRPPDGGALIEIQFLAEGVPQLLSDLTGMEVMIDLRHTDK